MISLDTSGILFCTPITELSSELNLCLAFFNEQVLLFLTELTSITNSEASFGLILWPDPKRSCSEERKFHTGVIRRGIENKTANIILLFYKSIECCHIWNTASRSGLHTARKILGFPKVDNHNIQRARAPSL